MLEGYTDERWKAMSRDEQQEAIRRETDMMIHCCTMIQAGLAVRHAGLIYFMPLCHDAYGENI